MKKETQALTGVLLDDSLDFSLGDLCRVCGLTAEHLLSMVEEGIVEPRGASPGNWRFSGTAVKRVQIAIRLQRDLRVNLAGAALILDLLEELEELRRLHKHHSGL
jgi:chaperone modulatory protein CbpM